jgi:hypothetical protein
MGSHLHVLCVANPILRLCVDVQANFDFNLTPWIVHSQRPDREQLQSKKAVTTQT